MSVIVKGMEMPTTCVDCELYHNGGEYGEYGCCEAHKVIFGEEDDWAYETIPNWCPLRQLPEKHGRLIDAVELWNQLEEMRSEERERNGEKSVYYVMASMAMAMVAAQDTIVEAEGEDG